MNHLSFDSGSLMLDGERIFLISGEFHYFRVPHTDWRRRMRLFKAIGGNCLATYVPWSIHEPVEGQIVFGDRPERDLAAFLALAREEGLMVLLRPGPYQYSELEHAGIPKWFVDGYPQCRAKHPDGSDFVGRQASYVHPGFLSRARRHFSAVAEVVRPFLAEHGGPVVCIQLDNEVVGIHIWFGGIDFNPESYGFGTDDGRYPTSLKAKYGTIDAVNDAYGTRWASFAEARPIRQLPPEATPGDERRRCDFHDCYYASISAYLLTLRGWLEADGVRGPFCTNAANPEMNPCFEEVCREQGKGFLFGSDHYYTLGPKWGTENPTPKYALTTQFSVDVQNAFGKPPLVLELPGGSPSDFPPILPNDILACYLVNFVMGVKGVNYYVFTGGPNFEDTGETDDIYDYNALVRADGSLNATYAAAKAFGVFVAARRDLLDAERAASVQIGCEWRFLRRYMSAPGHAEGAGAIGRDVWTFMEGGLRATCLRSAFPARCVSLNAPLDPAKPLLLPTPVAMSAEAQQRIVDFVRAGGGLLAAPGLPALDLDLRPCTILTDAIAGGTLKTEPCEKPVRSLVVDGKHLFRMNEPRVLTELPDNTEVLATTRSGRPVAFQRRVGAGRVIVLTFTWDTFSIAQVEFVESLLRRLDAIPVATSSMRTLLPVVLERPDGTRHIFAMNLHASPQQAVFTLYDADGAIARHIPVESAAMEVKEV